MQRSRGVRHKFSVVIGMRLGPRRRRLNASTATHRKAAPVISIAAALVLTALTPPYEGLHVIGANLAMIGLMANVVALLFIHDQLSWSGACRYSVHVRVRCARRRRWRQAESRREERE